MKILAIITTAFVDGGGLTNSYMNYYNNMNHDKIKVDFASSNEIDESLLHHIQSFDSKYFKLPARKKIFKYCKELKRILKENKYDVVHIHCNSST
ncbi:MAG: hypothetical protein K2I77_04755, partial [Anaeroplasmataceae bacterium]|nr:hypothetical protein [Anaeroplasmataceae bacterium]